MNLNFEAICCASFIEALLDGTTVAFQFQANIGAWSMRRTPRI